MTGKRIFAVAYYRLSPGLLSLGEFYDIALRLWRRPGDLLVFGVGNDSLLWHTLNRGYRTVLLENDTSWTENVRAQCRSLEIHHVIYTSHLADMRKPEAEGVSPPELDLPDSVRGRKWPCIIVDAPQGWGDAPGRLESIYTASRLVAPGGRIFVHDCDREGERYLVGVYLKGFHCEQLTPRLWMFDAGEKEQVQA